MSGFWIKLDVSDSRDALKIQVNFFLKLLHISFPKSQINIPDVYTIIKTSRSYVLFAGSSTNDPATQVDAIELLQIKILVFHIWIIMGIKNHR